jgi:hypothetical protein
MHVSTIPTVIPTGLGDSDSNVVYLPLVMSGTSAAKDGRIVANKTPHNTIKIKKRKYHRLWPKINVPN